MKECDTCGNEIADTARVCRFCGRPQRATSHAGSPARVRRVNIESGLPTVAEGLARLRREIADARTAGVRVLRVVHGWGSSGTGGKLRDACRSFLYRELKAGHLRAVWPGDEYSRDVPAVRDMMARYRELPKSERTDARNPGITMVEL